MDVRFKEEEAFRVKLQPAEEMIIDQEQEVTICVQLEGGEVFAAECRDEESFAAEFHEGSAEPYTGSYTVIPKMADQILPTEGKTMMDDVTVKEIPVHSVANPAGGMTVTIGGE